MPVLRIEPTDDRRLAITVEQAAARYGIKPRSMAAALVRLDPGKLRPITVPLDGKKKAYIATELDKLMRARPGRGANLRRK